MSLGGAEEISDGRVRRGARNREAIVEALFELIGEGVIQPTAEQVAERAGVRVRTVFRHFDDMAGLNAELDRRIRSEVMPLLKWEPTGDVAARTRELVQHRAAAFERAAPYKRSGDAQRWRRDYLQTQHETLVRELRRSLFVVLPELRDADDDLQAAFELVVSFEAWMRLRHDQRLGTERAQAAMETAALAVVSRLDA
ncbi:MAG: TetR family transcriptional regulator [Myxococcota bacterium]